MSIERQPSIPRLGVAALLAGLVVAILQFPWGGGIVPDPPTCYGMFAAGRYPAAAPTLAAGAVTALLVWLVLLVRLNPRRR